MGIAHRCLWSEPNVSAEETVTRLPRSLNSGKNNVVIISGMVYFLTPQSSVPGFRNLLKSLVAIKPKQNLHN